MRSLIFIKVPGFILMSFIRRIFSNAKARQLSSIVKPALLLEKSVISFKMSRTRTSRRYGRCKCIISFRTLLLTMIRSHSAIRLLCTRLHPDIALVCLCGNHDVGNRPTPRSIARFRSAFGDEYLAFWSNGSYNIVLNNVLFVDRSGAERIFNTQLRWLENRLQYAKEHQAANIFVFAHHPWFLYDEKEDPEELTGSSPYPKEWLASEEGESTAVDATSSFPDSYFSMPKKSRTQALELFRQYNVKACFSGHFHQNLVSKTRWGMDMIITAPLSVVFESTGKHRSNTTKRFLEEQQECLAYKCGRRRKMTYESEEAMLDSSSSSCECKSCISEILSDDESLEEVNCRGVRVIDVQSTGGFRHRFVPL
jgi:hypothetical protein